MFYILFFQILIFPEGTNLTPNTKKYSDEFAKKNNLLKFDYVLHPRVTGFSYVTNFLKQS